MSAHEETALLAPINADSRDVGAFIEQKVSAGAMMLEAWLALHPLATVEESAEELFQILMGKRVQ